MKDAFRAGLWPACSIGAGLGVSFVAFGLLSSNDSLSRVFIAIIAVSSIWLGSAIAGTVAGMAAAPRASSRSQAAVAGALAGGVGALLIVVASIVGLLLAFSGDAPQRSQSELGFSGVSFQAQSILSALGFSLSGAVSGAVAGFARSAAPSAAPGPALAAPRFDAPQPRPEPPRPVPSAPAVPSGSLPLVQCPRCGTRIQAPPQRPVELVCPTCSYHGTLRA